MVAPTEDQIALLRAFVGAPSTTSDEVLAECWERAAERVARHVEGYEDLVPTIEIQGATKEVAAELFHRKSAPNGISQFADATGNPVRVARDPMVAAYASLSAYIPAGLA